VGTLVGREAELAKAQVVLDSASRSRMVRALRIVGTSGIGKTALAEAVAGSAAAGGWLVARAPSFRIHTALPLFAARRIAQALVEALAETAERYTSGLTLDRERPEEFEEAFLRILEGVTLDHRILLAIDDAQWTDAESRALLARIATTLADRTIVLLSTERSNESGELALPLDEAIALGALSQRAARELVRAIYPDASEDVARGIVAAANGRAMDLVAVATSARENGAQNASDVSESTRRVIAHDLALLDSDARTFLQLCALIGEPVELSLLQQLWPQEHLLALIALASGRYLVTGNDGLHFVHDAIAESILETIPIEIPLRYRIIEAIKKLPTLQLADLERLVAQSNACGDRVLERSALMQLSEAAGAANLYALAIDATERALALRSADSSELIPTYTRLSQLHNVSGRELDAIRVCREGLAHAVNANFSDGLGALASTMIMALWNAGYAQEANAELVRYENLLISNTDRANVLSAGSYVAMNKNDSIEFHRFAKSFQSVVNDASPFLILREHINEALFSLRQGEENDALTSLREAELVAERLSAVASVPLRVARALHIFQYEGIAHAKEYLLRHDATAGDPMMQLLRAHVMIGSGAFSDLDEHVAERLPRARDPLLRRSLLGAHATAAALRDAPSDDATWQSVAAEVTYFDEGSQASSLLPIVAAWCAGLGIHSPKRAKARFDRLLAAMSAASDTLIIHYPVMLAITAQRLKNQHALERIAAGNSLAVDRQPWNQAQYLLARGVAASALKAPEAAPLLQEASECLDRLGSTYMAAYAKRLLTNRVPIQNAREQDLRNTTRREREIAALVAEGLTNRKIAESLVLSERTVEGHIANLFAKVNVNSRTQLAAWFLRTMNPS
jgi:DNA-binding NarL/FixJ family response regulator